MNRQVASILTFLICGATVAGCSANHHSIYRSRTLDNANASLTTIDAKQRAIIASPITLATGGTNNVKMRFCAEPSPDVFSVLAQSASAGGSFGQSADPRSIQAAASAAYGSAEEGSTIARTQTINLLKEAMYRTCERLINGFAGELETSVQAVRDQRLMVATLAIEQLTNAARPPVVKISAGSSAAAGRSSADGVVRLDEAYKALREADTQQRQRQTAYDAIKDADPTCAAIATKAASGESLETGETAKQKECSDAEAALAAAKTERQAASAHYETLKGAVAGGGIPVSASAEPKSDDEAPDAPDPQAVALGSVADAIEEIVRMNYDQDEFLLLCLKVLERRKDEASTLVADAVPSVTATCIEYVKAGIERDTVRAEAEAADLRATATALNSSISSQFDAFFEQVESTRGSGVADPQRLADEIDGLIAARGGRPARLEELNRMKTLIQRENLLAAFRRLPNNYREHLSK